MTTITCDHVMDRLDELLDGELDADEATAVNDHLEMCAECHRELEAVRNLTAEAASLPRSIEPDNDLWPGIAGRIEARRVVRGRFGWRSPHLARRIVTTAAAAAVLVAAVTAAYLAGLHRSSTRTADSNLGPTTVVAAHLELDADLVRVRDDLMARLEQRRNQLSPATWSVVMDNLDVIDQAIARIAVALDEHPNDRQLNHHLAVAYRQQIDLLQRATRLPAEI
jgi:hypothetical protein